MTAEQLAINRVRTILERELDKRRTSHAGGVGVESLGGEGEEGSRTASDRRLRPDSSSAELRNFSRLMGRIERSRVATKETN